MNPTMHLAAAILASIGPDPCAEWHRYELAKATGAICRIDSCPGQHLALGLCAGHYADHRRAVRNEAHLINPKAAS